MRTTRTQRYGFTIVEMLVVVAIISVLIGILLPAVNSARKQAKLSTSLSNLRQLGTAHATYASEWEDRQYTLCPDNIASYGSSPAEAISAYAIRNNPPATEPKEWPPPIQLGWGNDYSSGGTKLHHIGFTDAAMGNWSLISPFVFDTGDARARFGWFRLPNARQFSQYLNSRYYDPVFFAPKDDVALEYVQLGFEAPDEYLALEDQGGVEGGFDYRGLSSYSLSPAALFNPRVMSHDDPDDDQANGWIDPWSISAGFRAPSMSQARYASLKTHMLEHHWLQNSPGRCNYNYDGGRDSAHPFPCQPYYFNLGRRSAPATLFYDGHVEVVGADRAASADSRMRQQTGAGNWGLWSQDTPFGNDGYFQDLADDDAAGSFHIFTTDGILGRDFLSD